MTVPVVLVVHLFFHIAIFIVTANQDVPVVAVVGHHLVYATMVALERNELRVAAGRAEQDQHEYGQHRNASEAGKKGRSRAGRCARIGQHVGFPSCDAVDRPRRR
jgi:hypothetical protein